MDDWAWDSKAFTATPTAGAARAEKRHCSGLHLESSTACKGSLCDNEAGLCCGVDFPARDSKEEAPSEHSGSIVYRVSGKQTCTSSKNLQLCKKQLYST